MTKGELETYDRYWDIISTEKTFLVDAFDKGIEQGIEIGIMQGLEKEKQHIEETIKAGKLAIAINAKQMGMTLSDISKLTGLTEQEIETLT